MMISGFTYCHNCLAAGYPIAEAVRAVQPYVDEVVAVDCQSDDGTREVLVKLGCRVIDGEWGSEAGETLRLAHALYRECQGEMIVHFEADEIFSDRLMAVVYNYIKLGHDDLAVYRLQLEQNFQRVRWYPEPVHRVWSRDSNTVKEGHTTNRHGKADVIAPEHGLLWDITNCFRDQYLDRLRQQAALWNNQEVKPKMVRLHFMQPVEVSEAEVLAELQQPHWEWTTSPFDLPAILLPLVGMTRYEADV